MAKFRMLLILLAGWLILLFNIERPDFLSGGESIDLASFVYVLAAGVTVALLMFPDTGRARFDVIAAPVFIVYTIIKIYISRDLVVDDLFVYITIAEIVTLLLTIWVGRNVSVAVSSFEDAVENAVLDTNTSRVLAMLEGEEQINHELFRARRFDRPVTILYLRNTSLPGLQRLFSEQFDLETAFRRRYILHRIAQLVEAMTYRSDIIAWHNDNLVICLPETSHENAIVFAKQLHNMLCFRLNIDMKIGLAKFPDDALILADLIDVALRNSVNLDDESSNDQTPSGPSEQEEVTPVESYSVPSDQPQHETRELDVITTGVMQMLRSLFSGPQLFPLDGMPIMGASPEPLQEKPRSLFADPEFWVNTLPYQSASTRAIYRYVKRVFDLLLVFIALPFVLPVMLLISLFIMLDDGMPVFYIQERTGYGGRRFSMYKFRTMKVGAPALPPEKVINPDGEERFLWPKKVDNDPRITRTGRILRKTSLDEIPQILNVLRGDMSIVGPRPTSWNVDMYTLLQTERLSVRPGITGLWQVSARESQDFDERLLWDVKYVEKMSLWLDLRIIWRTLTQVVNRGGA